MYDAKPIRRFIKAVILHTLKGSGKVCHFRSFCMPLVTFGFEIHRGYGRDPGVGAVSKPRNQRNYSIVDPIPHALY